MGTPWQSSSCKFSKIFRIPLRNFVRCLILVASQHVPYGYTTSIRRRPSFNKFLRHFHVLFQYNFDGQKTHVVSQTFVGIISLVEKSTLLPRTFFDVISLVEKSSLLTLTFSDVILMVEKSTLFARTFYDKISMSKNSTLQANKNIRRGFPLLVTLKSCLLQYYSS